MRRIGSTESGPVAPITTSTPFAARTAERRRHRVRVGYRSDDHLGTAKLVEFRSRIFLPTIDVMDRAQFFSEGFLVLPPRDRHRFEAHFRGKLDTEVTESTDH